MLELDLQIATEASAPSEATPPVVRLALASAPLTRNDHRLVDEKKAASSITLAHKITRPTSCRSRPKSRRVLDIPLLGDLVICVRWLSAKLPSKARN